MAIQMANKISETILSTQICTCIFKDTFRFKQTRNFYCCEKATVLCSVADPEILEQSKDPYHIAGITEEGSMEGGCAPSRTKHRS